MPARYRRLSLLAPALALWVLLAGVLPAGAAGAYSRDVYLSTGYERQIDTRTCTAAAAAMMLNFIARRDLNFDQMSVLRYEQPRDALDNAVQRGSDPLGWSRAATYYSRYSGTPTTYKWETFSSAASALRRAAKQIAVTGKPVGLLVSNGGHAMVMTGFTGSANPATTSVWTLDTVWISDPNGYSHRSYAAASSPLNVYLQMDATPTYDAAWYGKYIVIVPQA